MRESPRWPASLIKKAAKVDDELGAPFFKKPIRKTFDLSSLLTSLRDCIHDRDLILVTGKGGTGKSTLVAALAELAHREKGRALAIEFSAHPRLPDIIEADTQVEMINIDAEEVVGAALGRLLKLPAIVGSTLNNRILRLFIRTSPAVKEMIALDELQHLVEKRSRKGCPVIVDLPSTGHAISLLECPRSVRRMLRVGPLANVAKRVEELLYDSKRCELIVVALPEELPINETIELVKQCETIGIACRTVVVNQVPCLSMLPEDRPLLEAMKEQNEGSIERFASSAKGEFDGAEDARQQIERLKQETQVDVLELSKTLATEPWSCVHSVIQQLQT